MDTIGEKLHSTRESKGYSIEQVARDTNIAKRFLIALEEEDFSVFPGDPYLVGFLKNYSEYLSLDSAKMVALHRNMKLQEQPVPIEELLDSGRSKFPVVIFLVLAIAALSVGGFFLYNYLALESDVPVSESLEIIEDVADTVDSFTYDIGGSDIEDRFMEGSKLEISFNGEVSSIIVKEVTTNVVLSLSAVDLVLNLGDEKNIDLDGDGVSDISLTVNDIDLNKKTTVIKIAALSTEDEALFSTEVLEPGSSNIASRNKNITVVMNSENPEPFVIDVVFRGNTLLRYLADRGERVEKYFDKGETLRLDINREVMLWIANAGSFKAKISGIEVNLGRLGEISTYLIKWNENSETDNFELQTIPVY
jgi:cytoskeleton protein RodZ